MTVHLLMCVCTLQASDQLAVVACTVLLSALQRHAQVPQQSPWAALVAQALHQARQRLHMRQRVCRISYRPLLQWSPCSV
jgi:hypothetical protein